jgi:hypothetical protein
MTDGWRAVRDRHQATSADHDPLAALARESAGRGSVG